MGEAVKKKTKHLSEEQESQLLKQAEVFHETVQVFMKAGFSRAESIKFVLAGFTGRNIKV